MPTIQYQEIIIPFITFVFGLILGYLGHRYQIIQGKIDITRERFLKNIIKVESFLSLVQEYEYKVDQWHRLKERLVSTKKVQDEAIEILKEQKNELKKVLEQEKK